jgi:hypothetical protein
MIKSRLRSGRGGLVLLGVSLPELLLSLLFKSGTSLNTWPLRTSRSTSASPMRNLPSFSSGKGAGEPRASNHPPLFSFA